MLAQATFNPLFSKQENTCEIPKLSRYIGVLPEVLRSTIHSGFNKFDT